MTEKRRSNTPEYQAEYERTHRVTKSLILNRTTDAALIRWLEGKSFTALIKPILISEMQKEQETAE